MSSKIATAAAVGFGAVGLALLPVRSAPNGVEYEIENLEPFPEEWPFTVKDLQYLFEPRAEETDAPVTLQVIQGELPPGLRGTYYLNGPGINHFTDSDGRRRTKHPFDGHGFIRKFSFTGSPDTVTYEGKFVKTEIYKKEVPKEKILFRGIGSNVHPYSSLGAFRNILAPVGIGGVANTSVFGFSGKLFAGYEGGPPHVMDPRTLETYGVDTFEGTISKTMPFLAHTRTDARLNRLVGCGSMVMSSSGGSVFTFYEYDEDFRLVHKARFVADGVYFTHDFLITENFYVLPMNPSTFSVTGVVKAALGFGPIMGVLAHDNAKTMKVALIPRNNSVKEHVVDIGKSMFSVHHALAYEEQDRKVVVVTSAFDEYANGNEFGFAPDSNVYTIRDKSRLHGAQSLYKFTLDLEAGNVSKTKVLMAYTPVDFLSINPLMEGGGRGQPQNLFASSCSYTRGAMAAFDSIVKVNLTNGVVGNWQCGKHRFVGEPVFAPDASVGKSEAFQEDEGWVIVPVYDGMAKKNFLMVFDAENISPGPVATIEILAQLPYGFHGSWLAPSEHQDARNRTRVQVSSKL
jgi:all-trans-8'-apo-beta-carotenal 15,15'-oxygenase